MNERQRLLKAERFREFLRSVATLAIDSHAVKIYPGSPEQNEPLMEFLSDIQSDIERALEILNER